jgi:uncharacterized protein YjbI with pentapeptide repeats
MFVEWGPFSPFTVFFLLLFTPNGTIMNLQTRTISLQCANLQGVKMLCSNAEGASLKLCNFEDPSGLKANLEGEILCVNTYSMVKADHNIKSPAK